MNMLFQFKSALETKGIKTGNLDKETIAALFKSALETKGIKTTNDTYPDSV